MPIYTRLRGSGEAKFRAIPTRSKWWLEIAKGDNVVTIPLAPHEWIALREACYAPACELDQGFQALADRDQTPPADADNVGGPAPSKDDGAPLEIDEGDYLPGTDPLRLPD